MAATPVKEGVVQNASGVNTKGDMHVSYTVDDFDVPNSHVEEWRFAPLRRLRGLHSGSFATATKANIVVEGPAEVTAETLAVDDERLRAAGGAVDRVGAQAWTSAAEGTLVTIPDNTELSDPVKITVTGAGEGVTSFGNVLVNVGANATATVIVRYEGSGTHADNVNWVLGDGSRVYVVVDTEWNDDAVHVGAESIVVGRDTTLRHAVTNFGGEVTRINPRVRFTGPGGDVEMTGVYFADDGQYMENRLLVDHAVPNCRSNVIYKGALQGDKNSDKPDARSCWVGDVLIRSTAQGTDTYETNRNMVLTDGARADAIPNLEIETGEIIGAGHAATVGRFDEEQLFYLRARGIPVEEATRLIIRGFFNEVLNKIPVESVRDELISRVSGELEQVNL